MTRYRFGRIVSEWDGEDLWVGALPDGPIGRIEGVGALVLEVLADGEAHSVDEIVECLRHDVSGMPGDAGATICQFLELLTENCVVVAVRSAPE